MVECHVLCQCYHQNLHQQHVLKMALLISILVRQSHWSLGINWIFTEWFLHHSDTGVYNNWQEKATKIKWPMGVNVKSENGDLFLWTPAQAMGIISKDLISHCAKLDSS